MIYAEINNENICYAISDMGNVAVEKPTLIKIDFFDTSVVGKKYNNGVWEDVPQPEPEPTQLDNIEKQVSVNNDNNLTIMEAMAEQYEQGLDNRINDMEVQATIYEAVLALNEGGTTE